MIVSAISSIFLSMFKIKKVRFEKMDEANALEKVFKPTIPTMITPGKERILSIFLLLPLSKGYLLTFSSDNEKKAVSVPEARKERKRVKMRINE